MGYQLIETIEVGSGGAASIEFTGIPQDGVDLVVKISGRAGNFGLRGYINNDTGANYARIQLSGNGASATSGSSGGFAQSFAGDFGWVNIGSTTANTFSSHEITFSNYAGASIKSYSAEAVSENNATTAYAYLHAGAWNSTSAITSLKFYVTTNDWAEFTTASLYKITAA